MRVGGSEVWEYILEITYCVELSRIDALHLRGVGHVSAVFRCIPVEGRSLLPGQRCCSVPDDCMALAFPFWVFLFFKIVFLLGFEKMAAELTGMESTSLHTQMPRF